MRLILPGIILGLFFAGGIIWWVMEQNPSPPLCQKETVCFDKVSGTQEQLTQITQALEKGTVQYHCSVRPSKYMETVITHYITPEMLTDLTANVFGQPLPEAETPLTIECELYENDKLDPGKKSQKCKLFAGYLLYTFKLHQEQIYKIQIDVMDSKGKDIPKRLQCIKESLLSSLAYALPNLTEE